MNKTWRTILWAAIMVLALTLLLLPKTAAKTPQADPMKVKQTAYGPEKPWDPCGLTSVICEYEQEKSVRDRIGEAAKASGLDEQTAIRIAQCESSLNPSAKNSQSSATGLFQFTAGTWDWIGEPGDRMNANDSIAAFMEWYPKYPQWWECA